MHKFLWQKEAIVANAPGDLVKSQIASFLERLIVICGGLSGAGGPTERDSTIGLQRVQSAFMQE
jgi:hypothetical protein